MTEIVLKHDLLNEGELRYKHLLGLEFKLGETDCYSILCHMLKDNLNIELTDYARPKDWWCGKDVDIYVDNYPKENFFLLHNPNPNEIRPFDVGLVAIPDPRQREFVKTNHCVIFLNSKWVIHHRMGDVSRVEPYRGYIRNMTTHLIRHKDIPDLSRATEKAVDLMEYILPHKRAELEEAMANAQRTDNQ